MKRRLKRRYRLLVFFSPPQGAEGGHSSSILQITHRGFQFLPVLFNRVGRGGTQGVSTSTERGKEQFLFGGRAIFLANGSATASV